MAFRPKWNARFKYGLTSRCIRFIFSQRLSYFRKDFHIFHKYFHIFHKYFYIFHKDFHIFTKIFIFFIKTFVFIFHRQSFISPFEIDSYWYIPFGRDQNESKKKNHLNFDVKLLIIIIRSELCNNSEFGMIFYNLHLLPAIATINAMHI